MTVVIGYITFVLLVVEGEYIIIALSSILCYNI